MTAIVAARATSAEVGERELVLNVINLLHDTTRFQLAGCVRRVIAIPGAWDRLQDDPQLARAAIQESLRYDPALRWAQRTPTEDVLDGDVLFPGWR